MAKVRKLFSISTLGPPYVYATTRMRGPPSISCPLVLIADDNCDTRDIYALYLSRVGYSVETAADGREAMAKAATMRPDLIVMDLQMPGVNGWRAMRDIRGNSKTAEIPVIVLTGHDFKDYLEQSALAEGACSFLMKPCLPEDLAREISRRLPTGQNRTL
jgi:CheY-like chemotaxis protein